MQLWLSAAAGAILIAPVMQPAAAAADFVTARAPSTTCSVRGIESFKPAITPKPAKVRTNLQALLSCRGGGVASARVSHSATSTRSCSTVSPRVPLRLVWNTSKTSTIVVRITLQKNAAKYLVIGKVTAGLFKGQQIKGTIAVTKVVGDCKRVPLKSIAVAGTVAIAAS
jgi:hypothetical protein